MQHQSFNNMDLPAVACMLACHRLSSVQCLAVLVHCCLCQLLLWCMHVLIALAQGNALRQPPEIRQASMPAAMAWAPCRSTDAGLLCECTDKPAQISNQCACASSRCPAQGACRPAQGSSPQQDKHVHAALSMYSHCILHTVPDTERVPAGRPICWWTNTGASRCASPLCCTSAACCCTTC